jgi:ABC-type multidrug transport system fused ATPase/permease subunit
MIDDWRKLLSFFSVRERRRILVLLLGTTASGLLQAVGIASIMPFIAVVADPSLATENPYLSRAYTTLGFTGTNEFLVFLGLFAFVMLFATNLLVGVNAWLTFRVCHLGEHELARRLLRRYLTRPYLHLLQRNSSELLKMLVAEIDRVVIGTLMAGIGVFADAVATIFIVALLLLVHPWITIATLLLLSAAYLLIYLLITPQVVKLGSEFATLSSEIHKTAQEALGAAKEIKLRGREEHFVDRFSRPLLHSSRNAIRYSTLDIVPSQALELVAFGGLVLVTVVMIGRSRDAGEILPMIALFGFAAYRLIPALRGVFDGVESIRYNMAAIDGLWREYSGATEEPAASTREIIVPHRAVRLEDIRFRYPTARQDTLKGIDLTVPAGSAVCLAGSTGAGKSTTVDILLGLLSASGGRIVVDETVIDATNLRSWQQGIGYVPQVVYLLDDTVASNIAFGVAPEDIDPTRLERAARIAQIHDFVVGELPDGYDSLVGERGCSLSGGQRQRIGIARALYDAPSVLVLDEATNELDLETEGRILAALRDLDGTTMVFVSHKPSVAAFCDRIAILENGRVAALGSYTELTKAGSRFRPLLQES